MGSELDLLKKYPKSKRNLDERSLGTTDEVREIARKFDKQFFDGERKYGYGGYNYHPRFWTNVVKDFAGMTNLKTVVRLVVKRFAIYDFKLFNSSFELSE